MKEPKLCTAPNCGEPIRGETRHGQHRKCYDYHRRAGKYRPIPASQPMYASEVATTFETEHTRARMEHGMDYRDKQLDGLVARIEQKMRNYA